MAGSGFASSLEVLSPRSLKYLSDRLQGLVRGRLWLQVLIAMVAGIAVGIALGPSAGLIGPETAAVVTSWLALPGHIFLAGIQMIIVPLVFASIIRGLAASENPEQLRQIGLRAVGLFVLTTTVAIIIGIGLATAIEPGRFVDAVTLQQSLGGAPGAVDLVQPAASKALPDTIIELIPRNPLGAMVNSEMLQVVMFAVIVGIALVSMAPQQALPLLDLLGSLQEVSLTIVRWAMVLAPVAVFGLMTQLSSRLGLDSLMGLSVYVLTVLLGMAVMLVIYAVLYVLVARQKPTTFFAKMRELQLLAFSTSSSAAVMPMSIRTAEEAFRVRPSISQFIIPLGATINMNGTALYQGVATVFLAQVFGIDLDSATLTLVVITAVAASIGSPATPGVGIVILSMVLGTAGIPAAGIGLIMGVDRILDMSRTAVNVTGDIVVAVILDRYAVGVGTTEQQLAREKDRELVRATTGQDVIIGERKA